MESTKIAGWTAPDGDIAIELWNIGTGFQVRELHFGGGVSQLDIYPSERTAREMARAAAEIIRYNQTGK